MQRHEDFNDDRKDAGDMGAGHTVTALFEVVPKGVEIEIPSVDPLEYQKTAQPIEASGNGEILHLKIRYKEPEGNTSRLLEMPVFNLAGSFSEASPDFCFVRSGFVRNDPSRLPYKGKLDTRCRSPNCGEQPRRRCSWLSRRIRRTCRESPRSEVGPLMATSGFGHRLRRRRDVRRRRRGLLAAPSGALRRLSCFDRRIQLR